MGKQARGTCTDAGCERVVLAKSLCRKHYQRQWHKKHPKAQAHYMTDYRSRYPEKREAYNATRRIEPYVFICVDCGVEGQTTAMPGGNKCRRCPACAVARKAREEPGLRLKHCVVCGESFETRRARAKFCPRHSSAPRRRSWKQKRVERLKLVERESYTRDEILERDGWCCHICKKAIYPKGHPQWTPRMTSSVDHLISIAHGGSDTRVNVRAAHLLCNQLRKHTGEAQLLLFG